MQRSESRPIHPFPGERPPPSLQLSLSGSLESMLSGPQMHMHHADPGVFRIPASTLLCSYRCICSFDGTVLDPTWQCQFIMYGGVEKG